MVVDAIRPTRVVRAPDGREWRVTARLWRADPSLPDQERLVTAPLVGPLFRLGQLTIVPFVTATLGRRPWIAAACEQPPVTMLWRATGRVSARVAVDEIADAIVRGDEHPAPFYSHWVGYARGGLHLPKRGS